VLEPASTEASDVSSPPELLAPELALPPLLVPPLLLAPLLAPTAASPAVNASPPHCTANVATPTVPTNDTRP